jgi:hypothetical protein
MRSMDEETVWTCPPFEKERGLEKKRYHLSANYVWPNVREIRSQDSLCGYISVESSTRFRSDPYILRGGPLRY